MGRYNWLSPGLRAFKGVFRLSKGLAERYPPVLMRPEMDRDDIGAQPRQEPKPRRSQLNLRV